MILRHRLPPGAARLARLGALSAVSLSLTAGSALAHTPIEGAGSFYNGVLHPIFVPAHAITLIALGLLLGQQGRHHILIALPAFIAALAAGLVASTQGWAYESDLPVLALAATAGALVALARRAPAAPFAAAAALCGFLLGLASLPDALTGNERIFALVGAGVGATFVLLYIAGGVELLRRPWQLIGVRIAGSWITAIALMVLALGFVQR